MSKTTLPRLSRRAFIGTAIGGAAALATGPGRAAGKTLNLLSHKVHQTVLGSGDGDLMKDWRKANDAATGLTLPLV